MNKYLEKIAGMKFPKLSTMQPFSSTPKVNTPQGPVKVFAAKPIGKVPSVGQVTTKAEPVRV